MANGLRHASSPVHTHSDRYIHTIHFLTKIRLFSVSSSIIISMEKIRELVVTSTQNHWINTVLTSSILSRHYYLVSKVPLTFHYETEYIFYPLLFYLFFFLFIWTLFWLPLKWNQELYKVFHKVCLLVLQPKLCKKIYTNNIIRLVEQYTSKQKIANIAQKSK